MSEREVLIRSAEELGADLEVRAEGDEGVVTGIAVPWNRPARINGRLTEQFARGAFDAQLSRPSSVFLARNHIPLGGSPIGRLTVMRNDSAGLYVEGRISRTPVGEETLTLLRDGVLDAFSVGFLEGVNARGRDGMVTRRTASLREVAIVLHPAYADARVTAVRCEQCGGAHDETVEQDRAALDEARSLFASVPLLPPPPRELPRRARA